MLRHKYHAKRTTLNGKSYASKLEAKYAEKLNAAKASGILLFYLEQVPFRLPGGNTYRLDFMEFWANGEITCTEVKGVDTPSWKIKKRLFEETYPITLNVIRKV